jgi:hypothetical protein
MTTIADAPANEAYSSGVSWLAVIGGAFVTATRSLAERRGFEPR